VAICIGAAKKSRRVPPAPSEKIAKLPQARNASSARLRKSLTVALHPLCARESSLQSEFAAASPLTIQATHESQHDPPVVTAL